MARLLPHFETRTVRLADILRRYTFSDVDLRAGAVKETADALPGSPGGWPAEEGRTLIEELVALATQPPFVYRHHWAPGDLVM